ncbi:MULTISPECIES: hypothetical protein [Paenibacillus]|nr:MULTISPECIES: hypothetical protein [Paenibacillus]
MKVIFQSCKISIMLLLISLLCFPAPIFAGTPNNPLNFSTSLIPFSSSEVAYTKAGGQVFVSNAPETINKSSHINKALYQDTLTRRFRIWSSHVNGTKNDLKFWIYIQNPSDTRSIDLYRSTAYGSTISDGNNIFQASNNVARAFLNVLPPQDQFIATLAPGEGVPLPYAYRVSPGEAIVHLSEWVALYSDDESGAEVSVSDINTTTSVTNPGPYALTVSATDPESSLEGDYRGVLDHYARYGTINVSLRQGESKWMKLSDSGGYSGEQENLTSVWTTSGTPSSRFVVQYNGNTRQSYWFTEYQIRFNLTSPSNVTTYFGAPLNGVGGFVNYQYATPSTNYGNTETYSYRGGGPGTATGVIVSNVKVFNLRTLVSAGNSLPQGIYFRAS